MSDRSSVPASSSAPSGASFAAAVYAFTVIMLGTTLPTPLYAIYGEELGFGVTTTTVIFAVYAAGVIAALIGFGRWSDVIGRRKMLIAGAILSTVSAVVFLTAGPVWQLLLGRVLSGLSAGIYAGAATTAVIELAPASWRGRAPAVATAANIGGLGLGPLIAGFLAEYAPAPLHTPFVLDLALLVLVFVGIWRLPETVDVVPGARLSVQRLSVPADIRGVFVRASIAAFAGFAVMGTFTGVMPSFVTNILGIDDHAFTGFLVFVLFASSALTQIVIGRMPTEPALIAGCALLILGTGLSILGLVAASTPALLGGAVICGVGQGMSFSKGLASVVAATPAGRKAEVTSTYFVVAYVAISIPIVGQGITAQYWGLRPAGIAFNIGVAVLALVALVLTIVSVRNLARPTR
ncbi:Permease, MFS superfamily protein [Gordonia terrae C-6]|uniref:Permease, MFS superfamily protein n=1 Tax=Gordonia terrae C-6 TaxID=1316928 RepID=R7Y5V7_9ACTN|nr:MFS transporter [Gordonia terrae]EON31406.1 Permease, MFS superfamily protein [Gordonia terrae C-6]